MVCFLSHISITSTLLGNNDTTESLGNHIKIILGGNTLLKKNVLGSLLDFVSAR